MVVWVTAPTRRAIRRLDLAAADAHDRFGQIPLAQGQADRAADQADPHDGHIFQVFDCSPRQWFRPRKAGLYQGTGRRRQGAGGRGKAGEPEASASGRAAYPSSPAGRHRFRLKRLFVHRRHTGQ